MFKTPYKKLFELLIEVREMTLALKDSTFRYNVKSAIIFEVTNTNKYPLQNLHMELEAIGLDYEAAPPLDELPPLSNVEITISCRFRKSEQDPEQLRVRVDYEFAGRKRVISKVFPITIKAMMERQTRRFR
jgi:hypothetical protein